jgi:hypothetical protein
MVVAGIRSRLSVVIERLMLVCLIPSLHNNHTCRIVFLVSYSLAQLSETRLPNSFQHTHSRQVFHLTLEEPWHQFKLLRISCPS